MHASSPRSAGERDEVALLARHARPLRGAVDLDPLLDRIGDARVVMLGEASHGTSEYYTWRAWLTRRLILEKGFSFIAVEGDWPACARVNRFVQHLDERDADVADALHGFGRWPTWMWANWEVAALAAWLRRHNAERPTERRVGFYGLDVYSLWESLDAIQRYLEIADPAALPLAHDAFACFEPYGQDPQAYARATAFVPDSCEDEVVALLREIREDAAGRADDAEGRFDAEQNARVAVDAERYYRSMIRGGAASWNVRDRHMMATLDDLLLHHGPHAKAIVWEHNTHIGDARATDMAGAGMVNTGQLARDRYGRDDVVLVGFAGHHGDVIAGRSWGAEMERMPVPDAQPGSWEDLLHAAGPRDALLLTRELADLSGLRRGHRAIGVVYDPQRERYGNYVPTDLVARYDALLSLHATRALHPFHLPARAPGPPDTYPWGM